MRRGGTGGGQPLAARSRERVPADRVAEEVDAGEEAEAGAAGVAAHATRRRDLGLRPATIVSKTPTWAATMIARTVGIAVCVNRSGRGNKSSQTPMCWRGVSGQPISLIPDHVAARGSPPLMWGAAWRPAGSRLGPTMRASPEIPIRRVAVSFPAEHLAQALEARLVDAADYLDRLGL